MREFGNIRFSLDPGKMPGQEVRRVRLSNPLAPEDARANPTVGIFGLRFNTGEAAAVVAAVAAAPSHEPRMIVTANVDHIVQLSENAEFRGAYDRAAARTLDGMPLVWLARRACRQPVHRVTGHDLLACILADPPAFARRIFFVASRQDAADTLTERLQAGGLPRGSVTSVVPPFGFEADSAYSQALIEPIRAHGTTLLVMAVGAPKSEIWIDRHRALLGDPVVFCVGDALNVAAGCMSGRPVWCRSWGSNGSSGSCRHRAGCSTVTSSSPGGSLVS